MADLTQTPSAVRTGVDAVTQIVRSGENGISAGMPVFMDEDDGLYYRSDANDVDRASVDGIALTGAVDEDYFIIQTDGLMQLGATTVAGELYIVSGTIGKIAPCTDLASGMYPLVIGPALDASGQIDLALSSGTVAHT